ncbi:PucR family transcriptional regulator [Zhihengliuella salsuginis]|uniref:PucR family transcriptional regulator n=1 Tax=Zhihengliuella salsuginis TaxID=578222 RepID=A0ABQ3GKE4_9MICC|nr:PucR family transcriptional regulator [Zhihengliuella salsuginis]GHD10979.1 PucR family transcriptional regulator [Zhihengliuella salsuginis]
MTATLSTLINDSGLGLRLRTRPVEGSALDTPLTWVASSDLADPTPFLSTGNTLLTTGAQFRSDEPVPYAEYVARLIEHGIVGLGFGSGVLRERVPDPLLLACDQAGLPLFEVPYRVPFLAVIHYVADSVAASRHARENWALSAQRAISFAALRTDGLSACLAELARQLGSWVALFDADGKRAHLSGAPPAVADDPALARLVGGEVDRLLARGQRSSSTAEHDGGALTFQTIGRRGELRGVLVLGGSPGGAGLDQAGRTVVSSVIALVGLALEQNRSLTRSRAALRTGLLAALVAGDVRLVKDIAQRMKSPLPPEPVRVLQLDVPESGRDRLRDWLEDRMNEHPGRLFAGREGGAVVVLAGEAETEGTVQRLAGTYADRVGVSDPHPYADLATGLRQARQAYERAAARGEATATFADIAAGDMADLLPTQRARDVAQSMLSPLTRHDAANETDLTGALRVWLEHNGQWEPAARELGIHRHTLKGRISTVERVLGQSLAGFDGRANIWLALRALG